MDVFERKALRMIYGPLRVADDFRIRYNSELFELLNDIDIMQRVNNHACWLGHVVRMEEDVWRSGYLMRGSTEVGEEDDFASDGKSK